MFKRSFLIAVLWPLVVCASEVTFHQASEQNVIYGMDHGAALLMDVYQPEEANGLGLVFVMGTAFTAYGEYDDIPLKDLDRWLLSNGIFADYYGEERQAFGPALDAGFTVFSINHRLGPKHTWTTQRRDCQRAVQFIRYNARSYGIDPTWIAGLGHSSGATMITFLAVSDEIADPQAPDPINRESSRLQAVVAAAGVHDTLGQQKANPSSGAMLMSMIGRSITWQPPTHPIYAEYREASTISHVSQGDAPIFLIHGTDDDIVPLAQSEIMANAYESVGLDCRLVKVEGANHAQLATSDKQSYLPAAMQWLIDRASQR